MAESFVSVALFLVVSGCVIIGVNLFLFFFLPKTMLTIIKNNDDKHHGGNEPQRRFLARLNKFKQLTTKQKTFS